MRLQPTANLSAPAGEAQQLYGRIPFQQDLPVAVGAAQQLQEIQVCCAGEVPVRQRDEIHELANVRPEAVDVQGAAGSARVRVAVRAEKLPHIGLATCTAQVDDGGDSVAAADQLTN